MVGYHPEVHKLTHFQYTVAGAFSGFGSRTIAQPFDVLKIRFQLQVDPIKNVKSSKYHNVLQAFSLIFKEEGIRAFWKGLVPAQLLSLVYQPVQFSTYEWATEIAHKYYHPESGNFSGKNGFNSNDLPYSANFICGGVAGFAATCAAHPFDVLRTRFVGQGEPKVYHNIFDAATKMYQREGFRAFYKGFVPTLIEVIPQTGLQFAFYALFVRLIHAIFDVVPKYHANTQLRERPDAIISTVAGISTGIAAKSIVFPFDLLKKRLQISGFEEARTSFGTVHKYSGLRQMMRTMWRHEGLAGFYKGFVPSLLKAAISTGSAFLIYEQFCRLFANYELSKFSKR